MDAADWIAIYAAIVATGALFLEIRRWRESGVRLSINVQPEMILARGGMGGADDRAYFLATVSNRGEAVTTLTHFGFVYFEGRRWPWSKPSLSFIVPHPHPAGGIALPHVLPPGERWTGMAHREDDLVEKFDSGRMWVEIWSSDQDRPWTKRIPRKKPVLEGATVIGGGEE